MLDVSYWLLLIILLPVLPAECQYVCGRDVDMALGEVWHIGRTAWTMASGEATYHTQRL